MPSNPYNCARPGNLFVGHEKTRSRLLSTLLDGHSHAVLGGRRCGKTSLLLKLAEDIEQRGDGPPFAPRAFYLDMQAFGELTPVRLFERLYALATQSTAAAAWQEPAVGREYESVLEQLAAARPSIESAFGRQWLAVFLIDELDSAITRLPDDTFFQNLRNLLMVSDFAANFRLVATGVRAMTDLISSGSSPLNNLKQNYLGILGGRAARELIHAGFDDMDPDVEQSLVQETGTHPYLLQGLLELLWREQQASDVLDRPAVRRASRDFVREHSDFNRWMDAFGPAEHAVYGALANARDGRLEFAALRDQVGTAHSGLVDEALLVLSYHGVVDDADEMRPELSGTLFRDWYLRRHPAGAPAAAECPPAAVQPPSGRGAHIHINIDNKSQASNELRAGLGREEIEALFTQLKLALPRLGVPPAAQLDAEHAIKHAELAANEPAQDAAAHDRIAGDLERAVRILDKAGATANALASFADKAGQIGPAIGRTAGWLAGSLGGMG